MSSPNTSEEELTLQRYRLVGSRSNEGAVIQIKDGDGDWVKYEGFQGVIAYIDGYLDAHCAMLKSQGVHQEIVDAIEHLRREVSRL